MAISKVRDGEKGPVVRSSTNHAEYEITQEEYDKLMALPYEEQDAALKEITDKQDEAAAEAPADAPPAPPA